MLRKLLTLRKSKLLDAIIRNTTITRTTATEIDNTAAEKFGIAATEAPTLPKYSHFSEFNTEQTAKILTAINNKTLNELQCYEITKTRAQKLLLWKNRNGPLKNLQDILLIEGFGLKVIGKFYKSLLSELPADEGKLKKKTSLPAFAIPTLSLQQKQQIRSSIAVHIGVSSVTWARLNIPAKDTNAPCELTDWQHHDILEKRMHLNDLVLRCVYINSLIPTADCYLFENPQTAQVGNNPGSVQQQNINVQKAQMQATISFALASRNKTLNSNELQDDNINANSRSNVFYLRRFLTARLFNHLVGTERVSSEETILNLMRNHYNVADQDDLFGEHDVNANKPKQFDVAESNVGVLRGNVEFPKDLRQMFAKAERYHREFLGQALLLNLAFVRLMLIEDPKSISLVSRNAKRDKPKSEVVT